MLSEDEKEKTPPSVMTSIPDDVIMECIAPRVPRYNHSMLSLVSKQFRSLVASPRLYKTRSLLGCTEDCVYVLIEDCILEVARWYSLNRRTKRNMPGTVENRLVLISSLPPMPTAASYVVVGSNIFVMGGRYDWNVEEWEAQPPSSIALCIDCRTHTTRLVADMPVGLMTNVSKVIDEKIYIVGRVWASATIVEFDLRTEKWADGTKPGWEADDRGPSSFENNCDHKLMEDILMDKEEIKHYHLFDNECVMGNILYVYDHHKYILRTYDPKQRTWGVVKGLEKLPLGGDESYIVSRGKMLILFLIVVLEYDDDASFQKRELWCAEITVERREEGEIWGKVECCDLLLEGGLIIGSCLVVTL
ncbi:unnamed protein product [Arabidopsis thaliana]|uniref:F-box domain-containing protein n=1 Tax=Arabidopsis thaliana TaxID=3702 RepID=A0A5S9XAR7_ARATH|nr:unnamed protein product [Arabidopsis thaliana]